MTSQESFDKNPQFQQEYLKALAEKRVARLNALSCHEHPFVRARVAMNDAIPRMMLLRLAQDIDEGVRVSTIRNRNATAATVEKVWNHRESTMTSQAVAASPLAPVHILHSIFLEKRFVTDLLLCQNPNTPKYLLEELSQLGEQHDRQGYEPKGSLEIIKTMARPESSLSD